MRPEHAQGNIRRYAAEMLEAEMDTELSFRKTAVIGMPPENFIYAKDKYFL